MLYIFFSFASYFRDWLTVVGNYCSFLYFFVFFCIFCIFCIFSIQKRTGWEIIGNGWDGMIQDDTYGLGGFL